MKNYIHVKLNVTLGKHKKGEVVKLESDEYGNPKKVYWRRRIQDSKTDNCLEVMPKPTKNKKNKELPVVRESE